MSDIRIGCIGALVILSGYLFLGGGNDHPANYVLRCLQGQTMMMVGFAIAVVMFGKGRP